MYCINTTVEKEPGQEIKEEDENSGPITLMLVGNPGSGKSTMYNSIIGQEIFKSGVCLGQGLTTVLGEYKYGDKDGKEWILVDSPGLNDAKIIKQAAAEITKAFKKGGRFRLHFVIALEDGRVRPADIIMIQTVMNCLRKCPEFKDNCYGVIVNKVKRAVMRQIEDPKKKTELDALILNELNPKTIHMPYYHKKDRDAEEKEYNGEPVILDLPEDLRDFILYKEGLTFAIDKDNVLQMEINEWKKKVQEMATVLTGNEAKSALLVKNHDEWKQEAERKQREAKRYKQQESPSLLSREVLAQRLQEANRQKREVQIESWKEQQEAWLASKTNTFGRMNRDERVRRRLKNKHHKEYVMEVEKAKKLTAERKRLAAKRNLTTWERKRLNLLQKPHPRGKIKPYHFGCLEQSPAAIYANVAAGVFTLGIHTLAKYNMNTLTDKQWSCCNKWNVTYEISGCRKICMACFRDIGLYPTGCFTDPED